MRVKVDEFNGESFLVDRYPVGCLYHIFVLLVWY